MNYWPAEVTNLSETAEPLMDYVDSLREPGRVSAEKHFGVTGGGWTVNTMNNPFGFTAPGWGLGWDGHLVRMPLLVKTFGSITSLRMINNTYKKRFIRY